MGILYTKKISSLLEQILARKKSWQNGLRLADLELHWSEMVGTEIAARTRPIKLWKGRLDVQCDHDVWRAQLQFLKPELLKRIEERAGADVVKEIFLK